MALKIQCQSKNSHKKRPLPRNARGVYLYDLPISTNLRSDFRRLFVMDGVPLSQQLAAHENIISVFVLLNSRRAYMGVQPLNASLLRPHVLAVNDLRQAVYAFVNRNSPLKSTHFRRNPFIDTQRRFPAAVMYSAHMTPRESLQVLPSR